MKQLPVYKKLQLKSPDKVFNYLMNTMLPTINNWSYLVDWEKVSKHIKDIEICLNTMNYLIGKKNITDEFKYLLKKHPEIKHILPVLVACRKDSITLLTSNDENCLQTKEFNFKNLSDEDALNFADRAGLLQLLSSNKIKNLVDYTFGIEVGLDSNARKNRAGKAMEQLIDKHIKRICKKNNFVYLASATRSKVKKQWGIDLPVDKTNRKVDFIIKKDRQLYLIEVNFYTVGGSKLKSTAGEYKDIYKFWKKHNLQFIWITDGWGWKTTQRPLQEAFNELDYILNVKMLLDGVLEYILTN